MGGTGKGKALWTKLSRVVTRTSLAICHFYSEPRFRANLVLPPVISYRLCFKMFTWNARRGRLGCEVGVRKGAGGAGGCERRKSVIVVPVPRECV